MLGAKDADVLRRATEERRTLVTNDKDFAELAFLQRGARHEIVLLRMPRMRTETRAARLLEVLSAPGIRVDLGMTVVEPSAARRRAWPKTR